MASKLALQYSTNCAMKTYMLEESQFVVQFSVRNSPFELQIARSFQKSKIIGMTIKLIPKSKGS